MLTCAGAEPKQLKALLMEGVSDTDRTVWGLEEELVSSGLLSLDIWICWVTNCTHTDQSALDFLTVHHTQGPVSTGLPHSASHTGTSQLWTSSQCITHRDQSALDFLTVHHTQGPVSSGLPHSASYTGTSQHWTASQCIIHTYRDWSVVVTHAGTGQWW